MVTPFSVRRRCCLLPSEQSRKRLTNQIHSSPTKQYSISKAAQHMRIKMSRYVVISQKHLAQCFPPSFIRLRQNCKPEGVDHLIKRVTWGSKLFRSHFSNFLFALGRVFKIFWPRSRSHFQVFIHSRAQFFICSF